MEFKLNKKDDVKCEVEFELSQEELQPHFEKALEKHRKKIQIPGFRKGKAPLSMIKKMYGQAIEYEALEDIAESVYKNYLKDNNVEPLGIGKITDMDYEPGGVMKFKVEYEVKPEIELKDYKGLELSRNVYEVTDELVEREIRYQLTKNSTHEETDIADNDDHILTLDIQKLDNNLYPVVGEHQPDLKIFLNDEEINPDLKEQLRGISRDENRTLKLKPADENSKEEFENYMVRAVKIEKVVYPKLDPDFFKKITGEELQTEDDFRNWIRHRLSHIYKDMSDNELKNNIVSEIIKLNDIPVPETFVENILHAQIDDIKNRSPKRELPKDFNEEEFRKTRRADALLQAKWFLIREKILDIEKLEVSDEDIEPLIKLDSERYGLPEDKLREIYKKNSDVKYKILDDKVMNILIDSAKITDVKPDNKIIS